MNSSSPVYPFERTPALLVDLSFFRRADRKERRSVLGGKAITGARGVSLEGLFLVKSIFGFFCRKRPKSSGFTPCFRLSARTGLTPFNSPWYFAFASTTTGCALVAFRPRFPIPHIF